MKRRFFILLSVALLGGVVWASHVASVHRRADRLRQLADEASQRFDFQAAHVHLLAYLALRPNDGEAHLFAARCARRAEFQEDFTGPDPSRILEALVHGYLRHLQLDKALICAEALLKREPENALALVWKGRIRD